MIDMADCAHVHFHLQDRVHLEMSHQEKRTTFAPFDVVAYLLVSTDCAHVTRVRMNGSQ